MRRLARPKPLVLILSVIALIVLVAVGQYLRLFERAWFNLHTLWQPVNGQSIAWISIRWRSRRESLRGWTTMFRR